MKVVILAGGLPSSIAGEAEGIPKSMVEIGGRPLLWHIMKQYVPTVTTNLLYVAAIK